MSTFSEHVRLAIVGIDLTKSLVPKALPVGDEYDSRIAPVYRILSGSRSEDELVRALGGETFGLPSQSPERLRAIAQKLLALDVKL